MTATQVRKDKRVGESLEGLASFTLSPNFTTRGGYNYRPPGRPPQTEPSPSNDPITDQIYRIIRGPGKAIYGDVQPDGKIILKVRPDSHAEIDIAVAVRGYGTLKTHLASDGFEFDSDEAMEQGVHSCATSLGYTHSGL